MDRKKQARFVAPAVGGTSLLVVFAVLCLTIFALLSLATVQADVRLADASAKAVEQYYAADCEAQAILARLRAGEVPEGVVLQEGRYCYSCPISDSLRLEVEVLLTGESYTILRWQAVALPWETDDTITVWDGAMF